MSKITPVPPIFPIPPTRREKPKVPPAPKPKPSKPSPKGSIPPEVKARIITALRRVLDIIAGDLFALVHEEGKTSLSGAEIRDACADYLDFHGGDAEAAKAFFALSEAQQKKVLREAFPSRSYSY